MKLSVSAYRAQASAHKKILKAHNYKSTFNYGSTSQSKVEVMLDTPGDGFEQQKAENPSGGGGGQKLSTSEFSEKTPSISPIVLTPRELSKDDDEDVSTASSSDRESRPARKRWRILHSVVEFYTRLRKVQRTKSNQRWMKLRTTVQLSSAIQTIQKKPQLKREDSFLKRFSTRQVAETQETLDTGDDDEDLEDDDFEEEEEFSYGCSGTRSRCCTKSHDVEFKLNDLSRSTPKSSSAVQGSGKDSSTPSTPFHSWLNKWLFCFRQETLRKTPNTVRTRRRRRHRRRHKPAPPKSVVNPDSDLYFHWLFLLSSCVLYNMWTLIVRQSFPELQNNIETFWRICDGVSDAVFILDVVFQLRTGYLEQGLMVYDSRKLAGHYIRSRAFLLDIGSLFPLDLLQYKFGTNPILRCPRFLKVYRIYIYYYMVESRTVYPNLWRVVNLIHILLILAHWFGCFYFLLSEAEEFKGAWVYPFREKGYDSLTRKYLGSLYWSTLTLTTIGDLPTPETNAEMNATTSSSFSTPSTTTTASPLTVRRGHKSRLLQFNSSAGYVFTIASYLIGVFIFATIVGQVGNVITNRNANRLEFERLLDGAKTYMRQHKVPGGMKRRVLRWYDYSWSRGRIQGGGDINTALGLLPDKLKTELALHVNLSVLKKVTIFQECQPEFLHDLVLKMKAYIFTPGDLICRKGEVAREMFIIADGILEVISETGRVLTTMKAGDFFGEIGILNLDGLNKRTADVRSVGYSELFSLSREDVLAAMKDYPEAQEILHSLGRKRLMEAKNLNRGKRSSNPSSSGHTQTSARKEGATSGVPLLTSQHSIVERLRSDVRGLKNALKKTKRQSRVTSTDDSLEMQSVSREGTGISENTITTTASARPPPLRRMSRVESSEESSTTPNNYQQSTSNISHTPQQPLGAGLPLLARLRLLKERQDREENCLLSPKPISTPAIKLEPPSVVESPVNDINTIKKDEKREEQQGLPLLQKIMLLKAKEDSEKQKLHETALETASVLASTTQTTPPASKKQPSWSVLRKAAIVSSNPQDHETNTNISNTTTSHSSIGRQIPTKIHPKRRPEPLRQIIDPPKRYTSIDDLSPEYSGLPFVKKLKILNERQKLAELERLRASSLDSASAPSGGGPSSPEALARCHSEASAIEYVRQRERRRNDEINDSAQISPESNETAERRNLKSILKKLSASNLFESGSPRVKKLLRAPTIEGYAVRHSKLAKSVTFNRETLQSPPSDDKKSTILNPEPCEEVTVEKVTNEENPQTIETSEITESPETLNEMILKRKSKQVKMPLVGYLEEEYLSDIIAGIKLVMNKRNEEMHSKLQYQFHSLELEIKRRDDIINKLQTRIQELETRLESDPPSPAEIPYLARGDSINTIAPSSINGQVLVDIESSSTSSSRSSTSQGGTNNMWEARLLVQELAKRKAQSQQELRGFDHQREHTRRTLSLDYDITSSGHPILIDDASEVLSDDEENSDEDLDACFDEIQHHAW